MILVAPYNKKYSIDINSLVLLGILIARKINYDSPYLETPNNNFLNLKSKGQLKILNATTHIQHAQSYIYERTPYLTFKL